MEYQAVFCNCTGEIAVSKKSTPEFYQLYQQSVFLSLKEQGILNETQYLHCLDILKRQL